MPKRSASGHFLKPVATSSLPTHVVSVSCRADTSDDAAGQTRYRFCLSRWSAVHRARRTGREDGIRLQSGDSPDSFWLWLQGIARVNRRVWILAANAGDVFRALSGWEYSDSGLIDWGNLTRPKSKRSKTSPDERAHNDCALVLTPACQILTHRLGPGRCTWVSVTNYLELNLTGWAATIGENYPAELDVGPGGGSFQYDPSAAANVIDRYFARLMTRYKDRGGGHWRTTAAQLSHQTWRKSHYTHPILEHGDPDVHAIEREALFGGRAEVNFYGTVGTPPGAEPGESDGPPPVSDAVLDGPITLYDVRSQYPSFLRDRPFPMAYQRTLRNPRVSQLAALCRHAAVIARVELQTPSPDYPYRLGGDVRVTHGGHEARWGRSQWRTEKRVCYPTGTFWTTLCGPELEHAITRDRVVRCAVAVTYSSGPAFRSFAEFMLGERERARSEGDAETEALCKLLANSFVGKFAAKSGGWRTVRGRCHSERWDEWPEIDAATGEVTSWRSLSGVCQKYVPTPDEPCGIPSIFAYCTSYGRVQMLDMIEAAGPRGWVWCHTDGIALTPLGQERIASTRTATGDRPGQWRETGTVERVRAWGPSHYFADGLWTLSGWNGGAWLDFRGTVYDWRRDELSRLIAEKGNSTVGLSLRRSSLSASAPRGAVDPMGWSMAPTLRAGERIPDWVADD